jgi:hypothetical protein
LCDDTSADDTAADDTSADDTAADDTSADDDAPAAEKTAVAAARPDPSAVGSLAPLEREVWQPAAASATEHSESATQGALRTIVVTPTGLKKLHDRRESRTGRRAEVPHRAEGRRACRRPTPPR